MKKLNQTLLTVALATVLTAGLAFAGTPTDSAKGEVQGCDNHSGSCGILSANEAAQAAVGARAVPVATSLENCACDTHSGACGLQESARPEKMSGKRSYAEIQAEVDRLLAVIDFEG